MTHAKSRRLQYLTWIAASKLSALSLTPGMISVKRSVLAVHRTITLSTPLDCWKSLMSALICSTWRIIQSVKTDYITRDFTLASLRFGQTYLLCYGPSEYIVHTILLVSGDEVWDVDGRPWLQATHVRSQLLLQGPVKHLSSFHGTAKIHGRDIPA